MYWIKNHNGSLLQDEYPTLPKALHAALEMQRKLKGPEVYVSSYEGSERRKVYWCESCKAAIAEKIDDE